MINVESESSDKLESDRVERDDDAASIRCRLCQQIYREPKLLLCGHSFCRQCVEQSAISQQEKTDESASLVRCPICQQINEIDDLDDFLLVRRIEEYHNEQGTLECRACTSNDRAVAHCSTCFDYLCLKCCQAHQYMKCFEQHQVRYLKERDEKDLSSANNKADELEQIRSNFDKLHRSVDEQRSLCLSTLDQKLTDLHKIYQENKEKIESVHRSLQKIIDDVQADLLSQLSDVQRQEEMHLIEQIEISQKDSQSFDEFGRMFDLYLDKCSLEEINIVQDKFFQRKLDDFDQKFRRSTSDKDRSNPVLLESSSIDDLRQSFLFFVEKFVKNTSTTDEPTNKTDEKIDFQRRSFLSSQTTTGTDSASSSSTSGISSLPQAVLSSSSNGTDNNSTGLSPSAINKDEFFLNSNHSIEPVVENLRALESIFAEQMTNEAIHPNLQRNIEEILQLNNTTHPAAHFSILTRQTSAPSLGQRSPSSSSNMSHVVGQNILSTYSSTNSGGSTNGNNSRSTTPFSSVHLNVNCPMELNYSNVSQSNSNRRSGQSMQVRAKFGSLGPQKCQFNAPHGFCLGTDEEIIVADTNNHRIQIFDKTGEFKYQFGIPGKEEGQLWYPRKVASIRVNGKFVVCDRGNERSRMQIFTRNGHFIKKISIRYIDIVAGLAITQQGNIVAVDSVSPTVFCISESGDLLKWFDCSDYMREPSDIAIFNNEYFVCDFKGHCVVVFDEDGNFIRRIGSESITNFPNGIDISDAGDVIIGDSHGNRFHIAVYTRQGDFLQEFDCPYVKVSRCCGLKITSDGFIVTLAKNNHHVLVLNTLYLP